MSARPKKFIKPLDGKTVPNQAGGTLDPEGEMLPVTNWWRRRERDGDVKITARAPSVPKDKKDKK